MTRRREELGLTRAQLAQRAGMDDAYVAFVEEQSASLTTGCLLRLASSLETTPEELLGGGVDLPPGRTSAAGHPQLCELEQEEALRLLAPGGVGRVALSTESGLVVLPVNFAVVEDTVVFRTGADTVLAAHAEDDEVCFEVDHVDEAMSEGWSVSVAGRARRVRDPAELHALRDIRIDPWAGGHREVYVRIVPERITGRRIRTS